MKEEQEELVVREEPVVDTKVEKLKVKKPKKFTKKDEIIKVDLSTKKEETKTEEDAIQEPSTESVDVRELPSDGEEVGTGDTGGLPTGESTGGIIEDITDEEIVIGETKVETPVTTQPETPKP